MGKSYKKFPVVRQEKTDKHLWNRKVRHTKYLLQNSQYKKIMSNWDNWHYRWTKEEAIESYKKRYNYFRDRYPTSKDFIDNYWKKICYRK